jgi:hypothetical protein
MLKLDRETIRVLGVTLERVHGGQKLPPSAASLCPTVETCDTTIHISDRCGSTAGPTGFAC